MPKAIEQTRKSQVGGIPRTWLFLLIVLAVVPFFPGPVSAQLSDYLQVPQDYPARDITVISGGGATWKKMWDDARRSWRAGN